MDKRGQVRVRDQRGEGGVLGRGGVVAGLTLSLPPPCEGGDL